MTDDDAVPPATHDPESVGASVPSTYAEPDSATGADEVVGRHRGPDEVVGDSTADAGGYVGTHAATDVDSDGVESAEPETELPVAATPMVIGSDTVTPSDATAGADDDEPVKKRKHGSFARELPILIAVALILALVIKAFLVQAFYIPSESMQNTLQPGDRVLVNKLIYHFRGIHRGEVVVFDGNDTSFRPEVTVSHSKNPVVRFFRSIAGALGVAPAGEKDFIKRVIGVAGDHVACCDSHGRVTVNGTPLDEPYLYPGDSPNSGDPPFSVTVPKGHIWVEGDHRSDSADSRAYIHEPGGGFVPTSKVIGRAFVKVWPPSRIGTLAVPKTFSSIAADVLLPVNRAPALAGGVVATLPLGLYRARRRRKRARRTR
jgi:signal peptidase I